MNPKDGTRKTIALVGGYWSTNIGNSFFNLGGRYVLQQACPGMDVVFIGDHPGYWTFWDQSQGDPENAMLHVTQYDIDLLVLQGPVFTKTFPSLWNRTIQTLEDRGVSVAYLGAGLFKYTDEEIETVRSFLDKHKPVFVSTRDRITYEYLRDDVGEIHCGIDSAFFLPEVYTAIPALGQRYIVMSFDKFAEPYLETGDAFRQTRRGYEYKEFEWGGETWRIGLPLMKRRVSKKSIYLSYLMDAMDLRDMPDHVGKYRIIRTEHRYNPMVWRKVYKRSNTYCSDFPYTYLNIYANASVTFTDRVHAAVATLTYGNHVMFLGATPRSSLLDRIGIQGMDRKPVSLDLSFLQQEKQEEIDFICRVIQSRQLGG